MFSKTNGFVVSCGGFQKARKQAEKALVLSTKQRPPFREHGGCISGIASPQTPMLFLRGSHSHEERFLFRLTILTPVIVPVAKESVRRATTKKCGSPLRRAPCLGLSFARADFRSFLFPIFQDVIQCLVQCSFHALFHDSHDLCFKDGLLFLLLFLSVFII